jgi:hypothetical protein
MAYIPKTCDDCGANLDPGEKCDCSKVVKPIDLKDCDSNDSKETN